jgi:hypothetical protein
MPLTDLDKDTLVSMIEAQEARYAELINLMREGDDAVGICEGIGVDRFLELAGPPGLAQRWRDLIESADSSTTTK